MKCYIVHVLLLLLLTAADSLAQDIPVGTWRTHYSYLNGRHLETNGSRFFCASKYGFFSRDIASGNTRKLSKIDGLSDNEISSLAYDEQASVLVVGYKSGYLDFISERTIESVTDIFDSSVDRDKSINDISFRNDRTYLASGVGVIVFETASGELLENYIQIGIDGAEIEVSEIEVLENTAFILSNEGVQSGNLALNLLDFNNWVRYDSAIKSELTKAGTDIYGIRDSTLLKFDGIRWENTGSKLPANATKLFSSSEKLYTCAGDSLFVYSNGQFQLITILGSDNTNDLVEFQGTFYLADDSLGLVDQNGMQLNPDGPISDSFSRVSVLNNIVYGFHAPDPFSYDGAERQDYFSVFDGGYWEKDSITGFPNVSDIAAIGQKYYFASIGKGLFSASEGIISDLPFSSSEPDTVISALSIYQNTLWVSSYGVSTPLVRLPMNEDGSSYSRAFLRADKFDDLDISDFGILWLTNANGNATVLNPELDEVEFLRVTDAISRSITDIELSVGNDVWVTTTQGLITFLSASSILNNSSAILPTFQGRVLFEDENINSVVTDGGNRVWFGSDRGLWLFDGAISEQLFRFTTDNSPLTSDKILSLTYNGENGEVYMLTDKGLLSYRSASSIGESAHRNVRIFPNPIRQNYVGLVGFEGLAKDAILKITDLNGNLVKELTASGGSASWDLTTVQASTLVSGIYLVFSSSSDGAETYIGKIAVIR